MASLILSKGKSQIITLGWGLLKSARPRQWLKNLAIFAPLIFSASLFVPEKFIIVILTFLIFSSLASSMYLINDVIDAPRDRIHPFKRKRPIAAGVVPARLAVLIALIVTTITLYSSFLLSPFLATIALIFVIFQLSYTLWLKNIIIIDVMMIAATFILRVLAGAIVIDAHVTVWFILAVSCLALFLAVGKRRSEKTLLSGEVAAEHRKTLLHYPDIFLDSLTIMFATTSWLSYAMFAFLEPIPTFSPTVMIFMGEFLPRTFFASKLLMASVPFVIYAVMRYLYIIYERKEGESPEVVLLSDKPLLISVVSWGLIVVGVIYGHSFLEGLTP